MVPGYLVVGTKRGGSTATASWIARHPEVAPCRTSKGTHYFDVNWGRGRSWYLSGFEKPRADWRITGEASPYYMFHPLAPARIAATLPEVKLVVVLREPAARAWSHHKHETACGTETLGFELALEREEDRLRGEQERLVADPSYESFEHRHHAYRRRGHYADQLAHLYSLFPVDRVLVLQSEALFADPHAVLGTVWEFLGLSPVTLGDLEPMKQSPADVEMPASVLLRLRDYYRPLNERLYALPGVDFRWPVSTEAAR